MPVDLIPFAKISTCKQVQLRPIDREWVDQLQAMIDQGCELPPVKAMFDGRRYYVWDGFHRMRVWERQNRQQIPVDWQAGDINDARLAAASANRDHGKLRRKDEIEAAIVRTKHTLFGLKKITHDQMLEVARFVGTPVDHAAAVLMPKRIERDKTTRKPPKTRDWKFFTAKKRRQVAEAYRAKVAADRLARRRSPSN